MKNHKEELGELCCADKNFCSIECAPKEDSESQCGCGGNC